MRAVHTSKSLLPVYQITRRHTPGDSTVLIRNVYVSRDRVTRINIATILLSVFHGQCLCDNTSESEVLN
jgi:hypothetical protein